VTADGAEILFDRGYRPRWHRRPGEAATPMLGNEWIKWNEQNYLFVGRVDLKLYKQLLKAEADFAAGREIQMPIREFDHLLGRKRERQTEYDATNVVLFPTLKREE
jgi:hypothetical protein